jgi:hypothetical protein
MEKQGYCVSCLAEIELDTHGRCSACGSDAVDRIGRVAFLATRPADAASVTTARSMKHISKWRSLGERIAKLKDGKSIVLECEGEPNEEARKMRNRLRRIRACFLIRRAVRVVEGKIVITRLGTWRTLSFIARDPGSPPFDVPRLPNLSRS